MNISIAQRNRPFSHLPGTSCLLPRTCWTIQAFPTKICCRNRERASSDGYIEIPLNLHGPVQEFTVQQDLENGTVLIWGIAIEGRFRLRLQAVDGAIELWVERAPPSGIVCGDQTLHKNDHHSWKVEGPFRENVSAERLSLGSHRAQDWESVWRRQDFCEIFPVLYHLSQWTPEFSLQAPSEMAQLLDKGFEPFLLAAFFGILCPRLIDDQFQGLLANEQVHPHASPCSLIVDAGERIRSLFVAQKKKEIALLPSNEFDAGRMTGVRLDRIGVLDFEWSKRMLQRVIFHAEHDAEIHLKLPKPLCSFRIRSRMQDKGCRKSIDDRLDLEVGKIYIIDRFQK